MSIFEIDENNLPFVRTRQALLILDLQNEFVSPGYGLPVEQPPDFVDNIKRLLPEFRKSGNVIWIRSIFEASRPVNGSGSDNDKVVTDEEVISGKVQVEKIRRSKTRPSEDVLKRYTTAGSGHGAAMAALLAAEEEEPDSTDETFLTVPPGGRARFVLPHSPAANIAGSVAMEYDTGKDIIFQKSHYSAFRDGSLVQTLRSRFVTELYICGALSNISVFATAMDAAQFGYAITLVDDCLGYRSRMRHQEALRRVSESTGCEIIDSPELIEHLRRKAKEAQQQAAPQLPRPRPQYAKKKERSVNPPELDNLMSKLQLKSASPIRSRAESPPSALTAPPIVAKESIGSSDSVAADLGRQEQDQELKLPPRRTAEGPERVRTKIKSRRRARTGSRDPALKDSASTNSQTPPTEKVASPTTATLQATSRALEKLPEQERNTSLSKPHVSPRPAAPVMEGKIAIAKLNEHSVPNLTPATPQREHPEPTILKSRPQESESLPICEGDTTIINNLLSAELAKEIFEKLRDEVRWQKMSHQGGDVPRLVAVQGGFGEDGSIPIYRHPADESPPLLPFSPIVSLIKAKVEENLGHPLNHVLIQFYRDGTDYISEHSDKTLDIVPKTFIVNVSLGAQRTMIFRTKKENHNGIPVETTGPAQSRQATRAPLPHNSMCKVGLITNMRWLHGIRQDKRLPAEKSDAELAYNGARISLTFRQIGTFLSRDQQKIWGQGATSKSKDTAKTVINGNTPEAEHMIRSFGKENHSSEFDWAEIYGKGFDVLHIDNTPKLFLSGDKRADSRVKLCLAKFGIEWVRGKLSPSFIWKDGVLNSDGPELPAVLPVKFVDNDLSKSTVIGDLAILLYLDSVYGLKLKSQMDLAKRFTRLQEINELERKWQTKANPSGDLDLLETYAKEGDYMAGKDISLVDWYLLPLLEEINAEFGLKDGLESLKSYYERLKMEGDRKALGDEDGSTEP